MLGGAGGPGRASSITGDEVYYGGGGGGGGWNYNGGAGGIGGGGKGQNNQNYATRSSNGTLALEKGVDGLGGGGGGGGNTTDSSQGGKYYAADGGCGTVIIRLPNVSDSMMKILGEPDEIGSPTPGYGFVTGLAVNDPVSLSMPITMIAEGGTVTNCLMGWKIESVDLLTNERTLLRSSSDPGESSGSCAYTHASYAEFTWIWDVRDRLGVGAPTLVTASQNALTLSADVTGIGYTAPSATLKFVYGVSPNAMTFTNVVSSSLTHIDSYTATLTRLSPGVVYYVRTVLETNDEAHDIAESEVVRLQTAAEAPVTYLTPAYIQGSGAAYIDTGYKPSPLTRTVVDYQILADKNQNPVFGLQYGNLFYNVYRNSSIQWAYAFQNDSGNWVSTGVATDLKRHVFDFNFRTASGARGFTIDGGSVVNTTLSGSPTKTANYSLFLGATRSGASSYNYICSHKIYSCQMYEDGEIVRDFIPAVSEGVAGLFDLMGGAFYPSATATAYSAAANETPHDAHILPIAASEVFSGNALSSVALSFAATSASENLRVAFGPADAGSDPAAWTYTEPVANLAAGATGASYQIPSSWGSDSNLVMRFYFDGVLARWSNPVFWRDCSAPVVTDIAADGFGGDTLAVSGTLASFAGADCTLSVFTGDSPTTLTNAWRGLAGGVRNATGVFSLTLFESDANAARYLAPGSTIYVAVEAVSGGKVTRTAPIAVTMKAAPVFASSSSSVSRRTVTFTGRFSDAGMNGSAVVTLYIGPQSAAENDLVAAESVTVANTSSFSITHLFPALDTTYKWQLRAVSTAAGNTATAEARTTATTVKTLDTTTYTWKTSVSSGNWSDAANWTDNQGGDCLGYPQTGAATAVFPAGTDANVVFTEKLTISKLDMSTGPTVTFSQGGASTNATKLTVATLTMHNNSSRGGTITLDGVAIASTSGETYLDTSRSLRLVNGANLHFASSFGQQLRNDVLVADGSFLSCNGTYFGGGTLTISNATFWSRATDTLGRNVTGGHVVFMGERPLWYHAATGNSFYSALASANVQLDFLVPAGGFAAAPIQAKATPSYYMGNNAGNAGSCALTVNVLDESPANFADAIITNALISWPKGISKTMVLQGHLPAYGIGAVTDDEFAWGDDTSYPKTLSVVIRGSSNADKLHITAVPDLNAAEDVSPAYGYTTIQANAEQECVAPGIIPVSEGTRIACKGWKLYDVDPATRARSVAATGSTTNCTVTGAGHWQELEWQWQVQHLVTATAGTGGTVSPAAQWIDEGATATVTATPGDPDNSSFLKWNGNIPYDLMRDDPVTFPVNEPVSIEAEFFAGSGELHT